MPAYLLNPHKHVKIWFSKDENTFLNPENQLRLVKIRAKNKNDEISFIYSKTLLSDQAKLDLFRFCQRHNIKAYSIENDISPHLSPTEKELMHYALMEIQAAKENAGGNLAAASDIVRVLSPVYQKGIYSDMDVFSFDTTRLSAQVSVHAPMILNIGSIVMPPNDNSAENKTEAVERIILNNDIFAIPEVDQSQSVEERNKSVEQQRQLIESYHQLILSGYKDFRSNFNKFLKFFDIKIDKYMQDLEYYYPDAHDRNLMYCILEDIPGDDPISVRNNINKIIYDPSERMKNILLYQDRFYRKFPISSPNVSKHFYNMTNVSLHTAVKNNRLDLIKDFYISQVNQMIPKIINYASDDVKAYLLNMVKPIEKKCINKIGQLLTGTNEEQKKQILSMFKYFDDERSLYHSGDKFEEKLIKQGVREIILKEIKKIWSKLEEEIAIEFSKVDDQFGDPFLGLLYKEMVVCITGPMIAGYLLDASLLPTEQVDTKLSPYSFQNYDALKDCFKSTQVKGLHVEEYEPKPADSSWVPAGMKAMEKRDKELEKHAKRMQRLFKSVREEKKAQGENTLRKPTNKM